MRKLGVVVLVLILIGLLVLPIGYCYGISRLKWHTPKLSVSRDGWDISVSLSVEIENPSLAPLPALNVLAEAKLNDHILFHNEQTMLDSLGSGEATTIKFTVTINMALAADLFSTLVDYLSGKAIDYFLRFALSVHILTNIPVFDKTITGTFELY